MASVIQRKGSWYLQWKGADGRWRRVVSTAKTKTEARRLAEDMERKAERARLGLEPLPEDRCTWTFAELMEWWLATYSANSPSHTRNASAVRKHLTFSTLADVPVTAITSGKLEGLLQAKASEMGPNTVNHLRAFVSCAFGAARRAGKYDRPNPVAGVKRRKVPRRAPDFLRWEEVPLVLNALDARWRPLFATAIYAGLRKGELLGLRKTDVDLSARLITVSRSYDRDTTKGGHADVIPIAEELVPYLERIAASPSELVFPAPDGSMMSPQTKLEQVLRRALGRAGITTGYVHVCRRKECSHRENAPDAALRHCPVHGAKLWPKAQVRPIRFHSTRHSTASLLMMQGANPAAVQRILRHSDPRITTEVYGHLSPEYLRAEVNRLRFGAPAEQDSAEKQDPAAVEIAANSSPFGPPVVHDTENGSETPSPTPDETPETFGLSGSAPGGNRTPDLRIRRAWRGRCQALPPRAPGSFRMGFLRRIRSLRIPKIPPGATV
jgi:integrase